MVQFPEKLIPLVILNALEGKPLPIYGKGDQIRDWLYVEDHARALVLVATTGKAGETYNIGGHNEKQNLEAAFVVVGRNNAGTGQNALSQAKVFNEAVQLTGISLTKLDGTAKGGVIFAIADQFKVPLRYIGVGEGIDDLRVFNSQDFIRALFNRES